MTSGTYYFLKRTTRFTGSLNKKFAILSVDTVDDPGVLLAGGGVCDVEAKFFATFAITLLKAYTNLVVCHGDNCKPIFQVGLLKIYIVQIECLQFTNIIINYNPWSKNKATMY